MRVLIVGSYNPFSIMLIERLVKESHSCFILTNEKKTIGNKIRSKIFEEYVFAYDSDSIKHVLDSANPEVIIFTGAYDSWFDFRSVRRQPVEYTAGLANLLISSKLCKVRHFIYLSSESVFEGNYSERIKETENINAVGIKGRTIGWGEDLCKSYLDDEMEITIIRIGNMYGFPKDKRNGNDFFSILCKKAMKEDIIVIDKKQRFSCIYMADAIDAIYRILSAKGRKEQVYHVVSHDIVTGEMLLALFKDFSDTINIEEIDKEEEKNLVLSSERLREEFGFKDKYKFEQIAPAIFKYFKKHKKELLEKETYSKSKSEHQFFRLSKEIIKKLFPFLENVLSFFLIFMLTYVSKGGILENINWFLLYVLVFSVVHGRNQSIVACLFSVIGQMYLWSSEFGWIAALNDGSHYLWVLMLFIVGLTVGHLKDKFVQTQAEQVEHADYLNGEIEELSDINERNLAIKKLYEDRIINYQDSLGKIYSITSKLDELEPGKVLINAAIVIEQIMQTENVTIYNVVNSDYCRMVVATSESARRFPKSLEYTKTGELYNCLKEKKVYRNTTFEENMPSMAHAIYNRDEMEMIIMIWGLKLEQLTLYQSNLLMILGKMLFASVDRAYRYLESISSTRFIQGTKILEQEAFTEIINNEKYAKELKMSEYVILEIARSGKKLEEWNKELEGMIRTSDYLGILSRKKLGILLTNTEEADSLYVKDRLKSRGIDAVIGGQ